MTTFETEGDVREYVEANQDEAVLISASRDGGDTHDDAIWFHARDGDFSVVLDYEDGPTRDGPILGDDMEFPDAYTVEGTRPVDEVPEVETPDNPMDELLDQLEAAMDEMDGGEVGVEPEDLFDS